MPSCEQMCLVRIYDALWLFRLKLPHYIEPNVCQYIQIGHDI